MLKELSIEELSKEDYKKVASMQKALQKTKSTPLVVDIIVEKVVNNGTDRVPELRSKIDDHEIISRYPMKSLVIGGEKIFFVCTPEIETILYSPIQSMLFQLILEERKIERLNDELRSLKSMNFIQRLKFLFTKTLPDFIK